MKNIKRIIVALGSIFMIMFMMGCQGGIKMDEVKYNELCEISTIVREELDYIDSTTFEERQIDEQFQDTSLAIDVMLMNLIDKYESTDLDLAKTYEMLFNIQCYARSNSPTEKVLREVEAIKYREWLEEKFNIVEE